MSEERKPRDNSGVLFRNRKKKTESQPDFTGNALIGGVEYWISGWARQSAAGNRYTSFAFRPKERKPDYNPPKSSYPPSREPGSDDDLPG